MSKKRHWNTRTKEKHQFTPASRGIDIISSGRDHQMNSLLLFFKSGPSQNLNPDPPTHRRAVIEVTKVVNCDWMKQTVLRHQCYTLFYNMYDNFT